MNGRFLIAFPVYNTGELLRGFLMELRETIPFIEKLGVKVTCIAIDDASSGELTLDILRNPPTPLEVIHHEQNGGCFQGLITALECACKICGPDDYVAWLDSDGEHKPMQLIGLLALVQRGVADLALSQIIWKEDMMSEYDRRLQDAVGLLEAQVILGPGHRWHQHCPGCWVVNAGLVPKSTALLKGYADFYFANEAEHARWGEDMSYVACVGFLGGRVNSDSITLSHMLAPNRPMSKVVSQYEHALAHLRLYSKFFQEVKFGK